MQNGYNKEKLTSLVLRGCTNITPGTLEEVLQLLPSISSVDIRGCSQFDDLTSRFPSIAWVGGRLLHPRARSLKHFNDRTSSIFKTSYGSLNEDSSGLRDYLESSSARDSANQLFRRSLYKRSKLFDAKRSSSILSRGAHLRHLAFKESGNGYKKMEEYLTSSLKGIMKENTSDFFEAKVQDTCFLQLGGQINVLIFCDSHSFFFLLFFTRLHRLHAGWKMAIMSVMVCALLGKI